MYRSSCRSAELVYCFHTGSVESAQGQAVRKDAAIPDPAAGEFGVWQLPSPTQVSGKREHSLVTHQQREVAEVLATSAS